MLLHLQRYNLEVRYKKDPLMYIADSLSRTYLLETASCEEVKSLELMDHIEILRVSPWRLTPIEKESFQHHICKFLRQVVLNGWPDDIRDCDSALRPFF